MTGPSGLQVELVHGDQHAVVVGVGGGLRTYSVGEREVLDGYGADEECTSGRGQMLIPWPNRIEDGTYEFDGERHELRLPSPSIRTRSTASSEANRGRWPSRSPAACR